MSPSRRIMRTWPTTGEIIALTPNTSDRLAAFDPTTFPTDSASSPLAAAKPLTTNSGAEVPKPMTRAPTRTGETPQILARRTAASTNGSATTHNSATPTTIRMTPSHSISSA